MNKILVVAVHPDDETLGCGGTLLKHKAEGDEIYWLIVTTIGRGHDLGFSKEVIEKREYEIKRVAELYNFDGVYKLEFPTMRIDEISMSNLIKKISDIFLEVKPNVIYLPFKDDVHSDHRKVFEATFSCTKSFRYPFIEKVYMMETLSETEFAPSLKENSFVPNVFVDITQFLEKKIQIMKVFKSEIKEHPFPRSVENIKALAIFRGATAGVKYAESFMLLKEIR